MKTNIDIVILCGGSGTRLWPVSRSAFPKQFSNIIGNSSLFKKTLSRFKLVNSSDYKVGNRIMITNEDIVPKNSLEFQTTKLIKKTHNVNWVNGLLPYDGAELLKKDFQLNNSLNVPALFKEDGDEYIMIKATTETVAKKLIDKIINANGGLDNFSKGSEPGWFYPHACEAFTVGYLIEHKVVRLNKN